ncbi:protein kinase family protein [Pyrobaculum aerophilum]|uniref:Protein kinase domain-containing protein n=1 Tax=Pyrobaculum aerophilum TaxID=13773 RepID=A0A371R547_9CREN|nr:protein kinase family protein [Pyrobaculum aerophilum]RFA95582.1 hypothetical protein CGL51_07395 [Pyrobaculum aerophilum]RFA99150.1 hypothetical protein CGL52_04695 [Pyrobaculum aerophilum]
MAYRLIFIPEVWGRVVKSLVHPNVLRLVEAFPESGVLLYEWGDGGSLAAQRLSPKEALKALIHVAEGLRYLHSRGLYHGDLKPENVIVVGGVCKIGDLYSLRKALSASYRSASPVCTHGYCAPEQRFSDLAVEAKSMGLENRRDIYQLGNIALSLFGIEPIDGEEWTEGEVEAKTAGIKPPELRDLIKEMLAREPWKRPNAEEVVKRVVEIYQRI